jgi:signal transduction histidine kinase/integral membrane sensor domain MASE1
MKAILKLFAFTALYWLLAKTVLTFFSSNGFIAVVWPPSGLALAALLIGGKQYASAVFLGALLINTATGAPFKIAMLIGIGNMLEAWFGVWILSRNKNFSNSLPTLRDYLHLFILAGGVGSIIAAVIGTSALVLSGVLSSSSMLENISHWWMGDALGIILITPLILVWQRGTEPSLKLSKCIETLLLLGLNFLAGQIVFLGWLHDSLGHLAKGFWMFLFISWIAVKLGTRFTAIALLMTAVQALWGAYLSVGYFAHDMADSQLTNFWAYTMILSIVGMALASYFEQLKTFQEALTLRTNELYLHNQVLQRISSQLPLATALEELAKQVETLHPEMLCSILLLDDNGTHLRHGAAPSLPEFYNRAIDGLMIGDIVGSCGTAAFHGARVIVEDVQTHPFWEHYRELAEQAGLRSCWSLPIKGECGRVLGTFAIYHRQPSLPSTAEISLIERYANLAQLAIEHKRTEIALAASHAEIKHFAEISAHHLQEPARRIVSFVHRLQEQLATFQVNQDVALSLRYIEQSALHQRALVHNIELYLAASQARGTIDRIDVNNTLAHLLAQHDAQIKSLGATIHIEKLPFVLIDQSRINDLFTILLDNALRYSRPENLLIVNITGQSQAGRVHFRFADNGKGIEPQYHERVFGVFERLQISDNPNSTGIGLAIVRRIVASCGGLISLDETPGGGTTVIFDLPG